jgi:hypothetical protein
MLYTWAIALGSVSTAATFGWAVGLVMFVGVEGFSRRIFGPRTAWLAPAILLSGFSISQAMSWAYVDLWVMFFGLIMLISLTHYCSSRRRAWLILAAVMVGFAIGTKYTAGALLFAGALMLLPLWDRVARREVTPQGSWLKHTFIDWIILGGIAFAVVSPWLLKNLILVENLIYPAPYFTNGFDPWMQTFRIGPNASRSILNDFLLPFEVTFFGIEGAIVAGKLEYGANVGPLMLALIPGLLLGWRHFNPNQKSSLIRLLVACLGTWLIWSVAAHIADELMWPRHYYGVFPAGAILAVGGFEAASSIRLKQVRIRRILGALVALAFGLSLYAEVLSFVDANPLSVLVGKQTKADYITQELGWYGEAIRLVNELPPESQVLFLWEPRTLYCQDVSCYPDGTLSNWWYLQEVHKGSDDIHQALCGKGVSHVLLNDLGLDVFQSMETSYGSEHWNALEDFRGGRLELLSEIGDSYSLYALDCSVVTIND